VTKKEASEDKQQIWEGDLRSIGPHWPWRGGSNTCVIC